jgi:TolA-binding protein
MTAQTTFIEKVATEVRSAFPCRLDEQRRLEQRAAVASIVHAASARRPRRPRRLLHAALAAALIAVAGAAAALILQVGQARFSGQEGVSLRKEGLWFESRPGKAMLLRFKDGSRIELASLATGKVVEADEKTVRIVLQGGTLSAGIRRGTGIRWSFRCGSYLVSVKGTAFSMTWSERDRILDLTVLEGTVLVTGAGIAEGGIAVAAGNHLKADEKKRTIFLEPASTKEKGTETSPPSPPAGEPLSPAATGGVCPAGGPDAPSPGGAGQAVALPESKKLMEQGEYAGAVASARMAGFDTLLSTLDLPDLWRLADAARYAEDGGSAIEALTAVRARFGSTQQARIAAFLIGRVNADMEKNPSKAASWFSTYLKEDPGGPLSEEALGRLMDAYLKAGKEHDASETARTYLDKYPEGTFAELANSIVKK